MDYHSCDSRIGGYSYFFNYNRFVMLVCDFE